MSSTTKFVCGEARWVVKSPKSNSKKAAAKVYDEAELKALLAPTNSSWADEEEAEVEVMNMAGAAKSLPLSYSDVVAPICNRGMAIKTVAVGEPKVADEPTPAEAAAAAQLKGKEIVKSKTTTPKIEKHGPTLEELAKQTITPVASTKLLKASKVFAMPVARRQTSDREPWRQPAGWSTDSSAPASHISADPAPENLRTERRKKQRKAKSEKFAAEKQTALLEESVLVDGPVKPSVWSPTIPVTSVAKPVVVVPVEPAKETVLFNVQVAAETVRPMTPVQTLEKVVVNLPPSSPRRPVSPVIPVTPRSFERSAIRTPPLSEAQPQSLETNAEAEEGSDIIVAGSACSPSRSRASSIMSVETVIITDSSQSSNPRPIFTRRDSEIQEHEQWFCDLNGAFIDNNRVSSPASSTWRLSPTAEPFVPRIQKEPDVQDIFNLLPEHYFPEHNHPLPDPSTSPFELTPQGLPTPPMEAVHPVRPVLMLSIPHIEPTYPQQDIPQPPSNMTAPAAAAPYPTPESLEVLRREKNRLDLILIQDDLIRDIEERAARLALRGLFPDGTVRDPLQVGAWEMQQRQQQMHIHGWVH
ncbi:hypothetical protein ONS95_009502 [Cadophora gregata]|uniref:uncharacterized protein n=1 Tax=Cadophora gregata TaxID=51156 RepID=UPI0026DBEE2A|nr:uncharacterized protein ONS95_009502 [Cadophora gregata]KAK0124554.1 hypothetical protein ONS95_009502 [Cadophora gregata]KAK0129593.1 hypothetical protein ONS96_000159 [Cadophora gregata f. sp. sojae]